MSPRSWFRRASLVFPGFERPLLPLWQYSVGSRGSCGIQIPTPEPMQILARFSGAPDFGWIAHRGGPRTAATVNGVALSMHSLEDGDVLQLGIHDALQLPGTSVAFHERPQPEFDAGWNAIAKDPDDEGRWRVQIDALVAAGDPLGAEMLALGPNPDGDRHFGFRRSVTFMADYPQLLESVDRGLDDPLAAFLCNVTLDCRRLTQAAVETKLAEVIPALVSKPRALRRLTLAVAKGVQPEVPRATGFEVRVVPRR